MFSFSADDAHLIQLASWHPFWLYMTDPETYQLLSVAHFTPLVPLLYQSVLWLAGVSPLAFFITQALLLTMTLWGGVALVSRLSGVRQNGSQPGLWLFLLAVIATQSLSTLLLRNYTLHYLLGGALAVWSLYFLLPDKKGLRPGRWRLVVGGLLLFLAFASKEIYWPVVGVCLVWAVVYRSRALALIPITALLLVLCWQGYLLGFSAGGRQGVGLLTDLGMISFDQWQHFALWYITHHWGVLLLSFIALLWAPRRFLSYALLAGLLLAPMLAAPHGFRMPEYHADRLMYPFHIGLALVLFKLGTEILFKRPFFKRMSKSGSVRHRLAFGTGVCVLAALFIPGLWSPVFPDSERLERQQVQALLKRVDTLQGVDKWQAVDKLQPAAKDEGAVIGVPPYFKLAGLMSGYQVFEGRALRFTPNCRELLAQPGDRLPVISLLVADKLVLSEWVERKTLAQTCQPWPEPTAPVEILQPLTFYSGGRLHWQITPTRQGFSGAGGVYFPERGLMIPAMQFDQRLVRPLPEETYHWFVHQGDAWWFSKPETVLFKLHKGAGQPL